MKKKQNKTNKTFIYVAAILLNNHNWKNFLEFYKTPISQKPDTGYFNFSSFKLKQRNKGKTTTEKYSPFLVGLQKRKYFTILI